VVWTDDPSALELLQTAGGPFDGPAYRGVCAGVLAGARDASYGAVAEDGTQAAIGLIGIGRVADSVPYGYGGVICTRPLDHQEVAEFLTRARASAAVWRLRARNVSPLGLTEIGRVVATTGIMNLNRPPEGSFSPTAVRSIRHAERAGGVVVRTDNPEPFLLLYEPVSKIWRASYPFDLVRGLARAGVARLHEVHIGGEPVSSMVVLVSGTHWMYWLGAQNDRGRRAKAGYLAMASILDDAYATGIPFVNLGGSTGLPGVAKFKQRFGAVDRPVFELRSAAPGMETAARIASVLRRPKRA
jgi:GNAT acetyltransferase-like protein